MRIGLEKHTNSLDELETLLDHLTKTLSTVQDMQQSTNRMEGSNMNSSVASEDLEDVD